jgi:hypothetical protein
VTLLFAHDPGAEAQIDFGEATVTSGRGGTRLCSCSVRGSPTRRAMRMLQDDAGTPTLVAATPAIAGLNSIPCCRAISRRSATFLGCPRR